MILSASTVGRALMLIAAVVMAGCQPAPPSSSQVAVKVNGDEISIHQVELVIQSRAATLPAAAASSAAHAMLTSLVDQELLAQAARDKGLDRDPGVIQQMEAAKRQVLAQAMQERIGVSVSEPTSDEIDRYHDAHPELFAKRRLYLLQETTVGLPAGRLATLQAQVNATGSLDALRETITREGLRSNVRHLSISAEDLPLGVLPKIAEMKPGESMLLPLEGGARALTMLGSQPAPLGREASRRVIAQYLVNERKRGLVVESVKALRNDAKVEYLGRYASIAAFKNEPGSPEGTR